MTAAVFLDRDGTISEDTGYMTDPSAYRVFPWTGEAVRHINARGLKAILITNQSGIARGYFTEATVHAFHAALTTELARHGAHLDGIYFCPHHPDAGCDCRKPLPGMLLKASIDLGINLKQSFMVGDRYLDLEAGRAAGTRSVLVRTGHGTEELDLHRDSLFQPDLVADNLLRAVEAIIR